MHFWLLHSSIAIRGQTSAGGRGRVLVGSKIESVGDGRWLKIHQGVRQDQTYLFLPMAADQSIFFEESKVACSYRLEERLEARHIKFVRAAG